MRLTGVPISLAMIVLLLVSGCTKEPVSQPNANKTPKTFLWLFPDSTIAEGTSKQRIRWWGEDPDGVIKGFLFASGKIIGVNGQLPVNDTIAWSWTTKNDSVISFPLLVRRDTFQIAVRGVDNSFKEAIPEHAVIRLSPFAYWDQNENGVYDGTDVVLRSLSGALDLNAATLPIPLLNQPPSIVFAQNPNDPTVIMQQPETTFTAATFSWIGSDPDGDQTVTNYEIALNDPNDAARWVSVPGNAKLVSLVVPRARSDSAAAEVDADIYTGTFSTTRHFLGTISHLKLNALNIFYVRARDIAGDVSPVIQTPGPTGKWFVKKPSGKLLVIRDYITSDSLAAVSVYDSVFQQAAGGRFANYDVLNIGRGLTAQQKRDSKVGVLVPPFIDPAFIYTLELFNVVFWYTDQFPSLSVAQFPLFQYVRDPSIHGKVIFTTTFESSSDPRGALKDFAPIDSVSSVDLSNTRLLPTLGDTRVPGGYQLFSDSSDADIYPSLKFNSRAFHSVFLRSIYRRPDAKYIYHIQQDTRSPQRYVYSPVISELRAAASAGTETWACGVNGIVLHSGDAGNNWSVQKTNTSFDLNALQFIDAANGAVVGDNGTILRTSDGGTTWLNKSVLTFERLLSVDFTSGTNGIIVGTNGLLIHTTNGGTSWNSPSIPTTQHLRSVMFADNNIGIAVGDSGSTLKTTNGGTTWQPITAITARQLNSVKFINSTTAVAVGTGGMYMKSTNAGDSWSIQTNFTASELRSLIVIDVNNFLVCGPNGLIYQTNDGGNSWTPRVSGLSQPNGNGQTLNDISFSNTTQGWCVASGGIILGTADGGIAWTTQPKQNLNVGVIDGIGNDGNRSFVFLGLPLHLLNGDGTNIKSLLEKILLEEFGE